MPNRVLREGFLDSEKINSLPDSEQNFFIRLMLVVDDYGRYDARPELLKSKCYPVTDIPTSKIGDMLVTLRDGELIELYSVDEKSFLQIIGFAQRTRIMRSKFPAPADDRHMPVNCQAYDGVNPIRSNPIRNQSESNPDTKQSNGDCGCDGIDNNTSEKEKTWRTDFDVYAEEAKAEATRLLSDDDWIAERQRYHPILDVRLSVQKAMNDYWLTEAGWARKKAKRTTKSIDWEATLNNALTMQCNQVRAKVPPRQR